MNIQRPSERSIIIGITKKIRNDDLHWYSVSKKNSIEIWRASEKITQNKSILYSIYHNMDNPDASYLTIHLQTKYKKGEKLSSDTIHILTIKKLTFVMMLLKKAIQYSGSKIINFCSVIIENEDDKNLILLTKDRQFDKNWILPGIVAISKNWVNTIKNEIKKYGLFDIEPQIIKYRNIVNFDGIYYNVIPYVVHNYSGKINENKKHIWIDKLDISNYYTGDESKKVINFFNRNGLPF